MPFMVSAAHSPSFETERDTMVVAKIKFREIAMQMLLAANEFASPQRAAATARRDQVGQFLARIEHAR